MLCASHLEAGGGGGGLVLLSLMPRGSHWLADTLPPPRLLLLPMPMLCLASPTVLGNSGEEGGPCLTAAGTAGGGTAGGAAGGGATAVSYTHLTLPTIYSV